MGGGAGCHLGRTARTDGALGVEAAAGSSTLPGHNRPPDPGTGAEPPLGGYLAGVQYEVSLTRGLAAAQLDHWLGVALGPCRSAEDAAALAGCSCCCAGL
jgi:hypothetical protein